jgi:hypothetical protein
MITIEYQDPYHHMPDHAERPKIEGLTLRRALKILRGVEWGNLGGLSCTLSDGTFLDVDLAPAQGGGRLMSSQRAVRTEPREMRTLRTYPITSVK